MKSPFIFCFFFLPSLFSVSYFFDLFPFSSGSMANWGGGGSDYTGEMGSQF